MMKLFLIEQDQNNDYDTYDSAVVAVMDEESARMTNPSNGTPMKDKDWNENYSSWCNGPEHVKVRYLGEAIDGVKHGIVCSSFNAG
jgi:hypothetical protein